MKKIMLFAFAILLCLTTPLTFGGGQVFALDAGLSASVIASHCQMYERADFSSQVVTDEEGQIIYLHHNQKVEVLSIEGDFAQVETAENVQGFVYKYYLTQNTSQVVYPVFNASVIADDAKIYDMDLADTGFRLQKGTRVLVYKSFSEKKDYIAVQVVLDDGSLYNGYMLTKEVSPDGISGLLVAGISIIIALVTIVLSIVFIKKKKKDKKRG